VNISGWVDISFDEIQKSEKEYECFDIEKREGSGSPKFQSPLDAGVAIERVEMRS
jgi:hypothetical protein